MRYFENDHGILIINPESGSFLWPDDAASNTDQGFPAEDFDVVWNHGWALRHREEVSA